MYSPWGYKRPKAATAVIVCGVLRLLEDMGGDDLEVF